MDSEQLLAQALRAQAVSTPTYGPARTPQRQGLTTGWVLLLALVMGLLAGAVAGLVTVL